MLTERDAIAQFLLDRERSGTPVALATLVRVVGSGFRQPGARMAIDTAGATCGDLSGGCLDGDVIGRARELLATGGSAQRLVYDGGEIADLVGGFGVGCPRRIEILLQPAGAGAALPARRLLALRDRRERAHLAVVVGSTDRHVAMGRHLIYEGPTAPGGGPALVEVLAARDAAARQALPRLRTAEGEVELFVETLDPPPRVLVLGGTSIVRPLVRFARGIGYDLVAVQCRDDRDPPTDGVPIERFPPEQLAERVRLDASTYAVVMEHHEGRDLAWIEALLPSAVPYVGVLGSRARIERIHAALVRSRGDSAPRDLARIYGPIGLDLGARSPEAIALAIVAEIATLVGGGRGGSKRDLLARAGEDR